VSAAPSALRKQALIERSSLARLHLRREIRGLRATAQRGARVVGWMRKGLLAANFALAIVGFFRARVRNRTDGRLRKPQSRGSTGEFK